MINNLFQPIKLFFYNNIDMTVASIFSIIGLFVQVAIFSKTKAIQLGQNEINVREMIENAKANSIKLIADMSDDEKQQIILAAHESVKNAYDEACKKYLDNKIDKKSFEDMYKAEIKQIVDSEKAFYLENKEKFAATVKVYKIWFKKNLITKFKEWRMKKRNLLKKTGLLIIIFVAILGIFFLSESWKSFFSVLLVALVGVLLPFLFDKTDALLSLLNYLANMVNPEKYQKTFDEYNQLLNEFANKIYFILFNILTEDKKKVLKNDFNNDVSLSEEKIIENFESLLAETPLEFQRNNNGEYVFPDIVYNYINSAESILNILIGILGRLPQVLDFVRKRSVDLLYIQDIFNNLKKYLKDDPESTNCELITELLLNAILKILKEDQDKETA